MVLVAKPELTTSGDIEWSATIVMRFVLPDGTKITAFRDLPFFVEVGDDGVLQGFKVEINGQFIPISTTGVKNKVYGTLHAIIAHESTHVVDFNLRFKVEIEGVDAGH